MSTRFAAAATRLLCAAGIAVVGLAAAVADRHPALDRRLFAWDQPRGWRITRAPRPPAGRHSLGAAWHGCGRDAGWTAPPGPYVPLSRFRSRKRWKSASRRPARRPGLSMSNPPCSAMTHPWRASRSPRVMRQLLSQLRRSSGPTCRDPLVSACTPLPPVPLSSESPKVRTIRSMPSQVLRSALLSGRDFAERISPRWVRPGAGAHSDRTLRGRSNRRSRLAHSRCSGFSDATRAAIDPHPGCGMARNYAASIDPDSSDRSSRKMRARCRDIWAWVRPRTCPISS